MDKELIEKLYDTVLEKRKVRLTDIQQIKFRWACEKTIAENLGLNFHDWTIAANIYLNFVLDFPQLDLGPIVEPSKK
jgi:hypothetical protein